MSSQEIEEVSGGDAISVLAGQLAAAIHEGGVYGLLVGASFFAGLSLGSGFNAAFEASMGQSFGTWIYDQVN